MEEMGLAKGMKHRPLLAMIARLVPQKGYDLLLEIIGDLLAMNVGIVVLTAGDRGYQDRLSRLAQENAGRMAVKIGFDEALSHRIIAGSDMLLVPSRYEPCGLTQIYALKYGTVPIVRATGGLEDTIRQFDAVTGQGNGFKFGPYGAEAFLAQVKEAVATFQNKAIWKKIMCNGMAADFSWKESALQYLSFYEQSVKKRRAGK
jgi:starch synthase